MFALCRPNMTGLLQGEHPEIFAQMMVGAEKSDFWHTKALISVKRGKIGQRLLSLAKPRGGPMHTFENRDCQNQRP